jgi:tetratricopeptide (TPR) repeat protein
LGSEEKRFVIQICQMLQGSPLGIELASNWLRVLNVEEVALEIQKSMDFLTLNQPNIPVRHRSIRAVFEYSWALLTEEEQLALKCLSVFTGGFRKEAAEQIGSINLRTLLTLTNKSLLYRTPTGRFERHALIQEFSFEKLLQDQNLYSNQQTQHGLYFFDFLESRLLGSSSDQQYLEEIEADLENIRSAVEWAIIHARADQLVRSSDLVVFFDRKVRFLEGTVLFAKIIESLSDQILGHHHALAKAMVDRAWLEQRLGQMNKAQELATRAEELLQTAHPDTLLTRLKALNTLANIASATGDYNSAKKHIEMVLDLSVQAQQPTRIASALQNLAGIQEQLGLYSQAVDYGLQALKAYNDLDDQNGAMIALYTIGRIQDSMGFPTKAQVHLREALKAAKEMQNFSIQPYIYNNLAYVLFEQNQYLEAVELCQEALLHLQRYENDLAKISVLATLGRIYTAQKQFNEAQKVIEESLALAHSKNQKPRLLEAQTYLADLRLQQGKLSEAKKILQSVLLATELDNWTKQEALLLLEKTQQLELVT